MNTVFFLQRHERLVHGDRDGQNPPQRSIIGLQRHWRDVCKGAVVWTERYQWLFGVLRRGRWRNHNIVAATWHPRDEQELAPWAFGDRSPSHGLLFRRSKSRSHSVAMVGKRGLRCERQKSGRQELVLVAKKVSIILCPDHRKRIPNFLFFAAARCFRSSALVELRCFWQDARSLVRSEHALTRWSRAPRGTLAFV